MTEELSPHQLDDINTMSAEQRYDDFIKKATASNELWGLFNDSGWVILSGYDDEEFFPVWPHSELAQLWATNMKSDSSPKAISIEEWLGEWLPGMSKNGLLIAVSPNSEDDCITLGAEELLGDMKNL